MPIHIAMPECGRFVHDLAALLHPLGRTIESVDVSYGVTLLVTVGFDGGIWPIGINIAHIRHLQQPGSEASYADCLAECVNAAVERRDLALCR